MAFIRRFTVTLAITGLAATGLSATALAADEPFGQHVSMCAHMSLGQRDNAPQVTCTHDGITMTFANFGAMVQHMRAGG